MSDGYWEWFEAQLKADRRATGGEPCRICGELIERGLAWKLRDRQVCSSRCNETLKRRWKARIKKGEIPGYVNSEAAVSAAARDAARAPRVFATLPVTAAFPYEFARSPVLGDTVERHGSHTDYRPLTAIDGPLPDKVKWLQEDDPNEECFAIIHRESGAWAVGTRSNGHFGRLTLGVAWIGSVEVQAWPGTPIPELHNISFGFEFISDVDEQGTEYRWEAPVFSPLPAVQLWTPARHALSEKRERISRQKGSYAARMRSLGIFEPEMEDVDPLEVLERDSWVCQICFEGIDSKIIWPDLRSPSMDHILPVTRGGSHRMENLQASHLGCNIAKGDQSIHVPGLSAAPVD